MGRPPRIPHAPREISRNRLCTITEAIAPPIPVSPGKRPVSIEAAKSPKRATPASRERMALALLLHEIVAVIPHAGVAARQDYGKRARIHLKKDIMVPLPGGRSTETI